MARWFTAARRLAAVVAIAVLASACSAGQAATPPSRADGTTSIADPVVTTEAPTVAATATVSPTGLAANPSADTTTAANQKPSLPAGPLVFAALGDSLTEGQGDDSGRGGYPGRLEQMVNALRSGSKMNNFGHSGWASTDAINGLNGQPSELSQALAVHPNVALVWIGSNDLWYLYEFGPEPMTSEAEAADLATYDANLDRIVHDLSAGGAVVVVALLDDQSKRPVAADPNPTEPAFPATTRADLALMSKHVDAYNQAITRVAAKYAAVTVDFHRTSIFTTAATLYGDGNHPNTAGYDEVARVWWAGIEPLLGR